MTPQEFAAEFARRTLIDEGERLKAYPDPLSPRAKTGSGSGDPWTIGIGHTGPEVHEGLFWTEAQVLAQFQKDAAKYIDQARKSLPVGIYDALAPARQFVVASLCFNMGDGSYGWGGFNQTHWLITQAVHAKNPATAHAFYGQAADHLEASSWIAQTGNRARRGIAMMRSSRWCSPTGDGSDVL